jgi:hypothetical protein
LITQIIFVEEKKLNLQEVHFVLFSTKCLLEATLHIFGTYKVLFLPTRKFARPPRQWLYEVTPTTGRKGPRGFRVG